jgi:cytokinin dehydrogenase
VNTAYVNKLTPPVNVEGAYLSVGGTISTGGFGGTSAREGFQVDHVLELQVVTGDGQLVTCSDERNSDLFNAALAGMGQCGIIVNVVLALVPAPTHVLFFILNYVDLQTAAADLTFLVNDGRFNHLEGRTAVRTGGGFNYTLETGVFYDAPHPPTEAQLLAGLRFTSRTATVMTYVEYSRPQNACNVNVCTPLPHPWLYLCCPHLDSSSTPQKFLPLLQRLPLLCHVFLRGEGTASSVRLPVCRTKISFLNSNFRASRPRRLQISIPC